MKKLLFLVTLLILVVACNHKKESVVFTKYDETTEILAQQKHQIERMRFKLIQSKYLDMNKVFKPFEEDLAGFTEKDYQNLLPFILEKDIPTIQEFVNNRILSYERIVLFYLYRIRKYESSHNLALNSIIALNPTIVEQAREKDRNRPINLKNTVYGLPILLKDNINTIGMPTTAGAFVLSENKETDDAFIVKKLKENGALILGKTNLSEWAYFFCSGCPVGYSAVGGQTLNPYGRKIFESGGSSSGSGVAVAANFAIAAVGTETSGSILSPASQNAVVGLKPTIGLVSRTGIVPISSTLDTPGPMAKSLVDTAILLNAMLGEDVEDSVTIGNNTQVSYIDSLSSSSLRGKRIGVIKELLTDSIYKSAVQIIKKRGGAELIEFEQPKIGLNGFLTLLNIDMKYDLPNYLKNYADTAIQISTIEDVIKFNLLDSIQRSPYGQELFEGILNDTTSNKAFELVKQNLHTKGIEFFKTPMDTHNLDIILSINNYHAGYAAVAKFPCLTVPMGFKKTGEPISLTFIAKPFQENKLLNLGYAFEKLTKARKLPEDYK
ncbi:amidase family protein [Lutibacter sp. A80]|uniref:amidase family protein n=1 Tax=Lutibacter sp. A80 TaxID=2918453 RepID=UPI001F05E967|nr:amidase family protein [Lutibacter sp. A80]UMB60759.1 amidase family protein [Lutibacter sp. A80]